MIMPFGKHRGKHIDNIPGDYLEWIINNCKKIRPLLKREIERVLREQHGYVAEDDNAELDVNLQYISERLHDVFENVSQLRKKLLRGLHPDAGGKPELFKVADEGFQRLQELLEELI